MLRNNIGEEGAKTILEVAKGKPQLTTLCGIKPDQTSADFRASQNNDNVMTPADAILLTADLAVIPSITQVMPN